METAFYVILIYCVAREIIFVTTVHRLVNKLMSRNYHEFKLSESAGKPLQYSKAPPPDEGPFEDFGAVF